MKYTNPRSFNYLINRLVRIHCGGKISHCGRLLAVKDDYLVLLTDDKHLYLPLHQVKSVAVDSIDNFPVYQLQCPLSDYFDAENFQQLLRKMIYRAVLIQSGPERIRGVLVGLREKYIDLIDGYELIKVATYHIHTLCRDSHQKTQSSTVDSTVATNKPEKAADYKKDKAMESKKEKAAEYKKEKAIENKKEITIESKKEQTTESKKEKTMDNDKGIAIDNKKDQGKNASVKKVEPPIKQMDSTPRQDQKASAVDAAALPQITVRPEQAAPISKPIEKDHTQNSISIPTLKSPAPEPTRIPFLAEDPEDRVTESPSPTKEPLTIFESRLDSASFPLQRLPHHSPPSNSQKNRLRQNKKVQSRKKQWKVTRNKKKQTSGFLITKKPLKNKWYLNVKIRSGRQYGKIWLAPVILYGRS